MCVMRVLKICVISRLLGLSWDHKIMWQSHDLIIMHSQDHGQFLSSASNLVIAQQSKYHVACSRVKVEAIAGYGTETKNM